MNNQQPNQVPTHNAQENIVTVTSMARLHMGFFDLNGSAGRMFGSIGLGLDAPCTQVEISKSKKPLNDVKVSENVSKIIENLVKSLKVTNNFSVTIHQAIPEHAGLGSGTQMALAIGAGLNRLFGLGLTVPQIATISARGMRSGIGIGTFEHGGLIVDGGRGANDLPPPIIARHDFPPDWPILLMFDASERGMHGEQELHAFNSLPKASLHTAQDLSHRVLMQALPALVERDYAAFSSVIYKLQSATGAYFALKQGGQFKSQQVTKVLNFLYENKVLCAGQSSWGPTGFAIFESEVKANNMLKMLQQQFADLDHVSFQIVRSRNTGAQITSA